MVILPELLSNLKARGSILRSSGPVLPLRIFNSMTVATPGFTVVTNGEGVTWSEKSAGGAAETDWLSSAQLSKVVNSHFLIVPKV